MSAPLSKPPKLPATSNWNWGANSVINLTNVIATTPSISWKKYVTKSSSSGNITPKTVTSTPLITGTITGTYCTPGTISGHAANVNGNGSFADAMAASIKTLVAALNEKLENDPTVEFELDLPDGTKLRYKSGNFEIDDANAKLKYKANRVRNFNRFLNASDVIADFLEYVSKLGVAPDSPDEVLQLPIELLIKFLIIEAAKADNDDAPLPEVAQLEAATKVAFLPPPPAVKPLMRCFSCGRFINHAIAKRGVMACSAEHAALAFA